MRRRGYKTKQTRLNKAFEQNVLGRAQRDRKILKDMLRKANGRLAVVDEEIKQLTAEALAWHG